MSDTRFLQVGFGSMGKRRVRCLHQLGQRDITVFDANPLRREQAAFFGMKVIDSFECGLVNADAVLVSTPPDQHYQYVLEATRAGKHTFCEANVITEGATEITAAAKSSGVVAAPSATMRFHPLYQQLKQLVDSNEAGKPLVLNFHLGNFILDWHPMEGLNFYAGRKETGACREMVPFEFEWMQWTFGKVDYVQCTIGKQLELDTDIDDVYMIQARFVSGLLANILIEVTSRKPIRRGSIMFQERTHEWDFFAPGTSNIEDMYVSEIDAWLKACRGAGPWEHTYMQDEYLSRILQACERSNKQKGPAIVPFGIREIKDN